MTVAHNTETPKVRNQRSKRHAVSHLKRSGLTLEEARDHIERSRAWLIIPPDAIPELFQRGGISVTGRRALDRDWMLEQVSFDTGRVIVELRRVGMTGTILGPIDKTIDDHDDSCPGIAWISQQGTRLCTNGCTWMD